MENQEINNIIIPIDHLFSQFQEHLNIENNNRVFFSGKFGIGKTYFLNEFFKNNTEKYEIFHLFPVNYQISSNEDIIELLKYDIFIELIKKNKELFELEKTRQLEEAMKVINEEAMKKATEENKYIIAQLEKKLNDAGKANEEMKRKLDQGSQQTQGEVLELELEKVLKTEFFQDEIIPVPKGINGADVIQKVFDRSGRFCGQII